LDDYSPGMRTITKGQAVVDLGEEEPEDLLQDAQESDAVDIPEVAQISLDEQDVANVKKVLDAGQKRRTKTYIAIGVITAIAIILVAVLFMIGKSEKNSNVVANSPKITNPVKKSPQKAVKKPVQPEKHVVAVKKPAPDAVVKKDVHSQPKKTAVKKAVNKKTTKKAVSKKRAGKKVKKKKVAPKKVAVKAPKPVKKGGGDAQSILNSLKIGKKKPAKTHATSANDSNLPRTLPTAVVNQVMRSVRPRVKRCLDHANIDNEGQLVIMSRLKIAGKGYVQSVRLSGHVGAARSCIMKVLKSLRFSKFRDTSMPVSYPYVF